MPSRDEKTKRSVLTRALSPFGTTIFTEMTALAERHDAVNLSQGFPDFDGPEAIRRRAAEAVIRGPNQYTPSAGIPELREAISRKMERFYGLDVDPEREVTVTAGATEALCATFLGILEPGDEVILLEPWYDSYPPILSMAHARIRYVPLRPPLFDLPRDELARAFGPGTRAIVINNPQNPIGKVYTEEELSYIGALCEEHDAYAVGDEVYENLVYDGRSHVTLLGIPALRDRAFVISSTAKTFSMTGWKIGYVVASSGLSHAVRMSHQFITFCGQGALQKAMAAALDSPDGYYRQLLADYTGRRDLLCAGLEDIGFGVTVPQGCYFVVSDITPLGYEGDFSFCHMLPREAGVAAIPCSCFYRDRHEGRRLVRFCFCKSEDTLHEALRRLGRWRR
jgi:N-succinyldiaminopimelate aminotransferase